MQLRYLDRFLPHPHRVYAFLTNVPAGHESKFHYSSTEPIKEHAVKLNLLAEVIRLSAEDTSDILIFIDGDAFPIAPLEPLIRDCLEQHSLIAVQRYENFGDVQPHPCFCVTSVGCWHDLRGDWKPGYSWHDLGGKKLTDVGGNLLGLLEHAGVDWHRLVRVNVHNPHPILFGFYGDAQHGAVVYHHGAGFRGAPERVARLAAGEDKLEVAIRAKAIDHLRRYLSTGSELLLQIHPVTRMEHRLTEQEQHLAEPIFSQIERDEVFWHAFLPTGSP